MLKIFIYLIKVTDIEVLKIFVYFIKVGTFNKLLFFCLSKIDVDGISGFPRFKNALIKIALPAVKQNGGYPDYGY